jgi:hypothetical protein
MLSPMIAGVFTSAKQEYRIANNPGTEKQAFSKERESNGNSFINSEKKQALRRSSYNRQDP